MLKLLVIDNPRVAQAFIDYMASRHIDIDMMPEEGGKVALWLKEDQFQLEAESELKQFLQNPADRKYLAASWEMADSRTRKFSYHTPSMLNMIKAKAGPLTLLLMTVAIVLFIAQQIGLAQAIFSSLHFPAYDSQKWQLWRWVSHALLHFSVMHIAFNLLWWWQLGGDIEKRLGTLKLLQIFLVSAALSGAGQYWVEDANFGGLSGVVYALLGYTWLLGSRAPQKGLAVPKPIVVFMLVWLVLGYVQPYMAIANTAHLVGLLSGVVLGWLDSQKSS
ncbi:rhomboid family intramembrane serine protease GlpG [Vibrio sp. MACH09]|uniref:rhomboid family intramembrane serine protease GlpG n=1 Tax=unclassified Vibrio TaxID=2614977 RepID=UPI001493CEBF|nr:MULTISPECIES: rhomboid family intramembrane serine protease GlpG [unclassified Vibrio]NOI68458.1 rhomboid family intramembrane serine protease GlpG [Vibrio sp. 99-8-1]GLO62279.1 rhomboid family intramembrane serine protease GlpG [Vibrio sp. MACH09]